MHLLDRTNFFLVVSASLLTFFLYSKSHIVYTGQVNMIGLVQVISNINARQEQITFLSRVINPQTSEEIASGISRVSGCKFIDSKNWDCRMETLEGLKMINGKLSRENMVENWQYEKYLVLPWGQRIPF